MQVLHPPPLTAQAAHVPAFAWPSEGAMVLASTDGAGYKVALASLVAGARERWSHGVVVTANRPVATLAPALASAVGALRLHFVDCVSGLTGLPPPDRADTTFVESPAFLEKVMLRASRALTAMPTGGRFCIVDSLSTLAVYNDVDTVAEWSHSLLGRLRTLATPCASIVVAGQAAGDLLERVRPHYDHLVHL